MNHLGTAQYQRRMLGFSDHSIYGVAVSKGIATAFVSWWELEVNGSCIIIFAFFVRCIDLTSADTYFHIFPGNFLVLIQYQCERSCEIRSLDTTRMCAVLHLPYPRQARYRSDISCGFTMVGIGRCCGSSGRDGFRYRSEWVEVLG